MENWNKKMENEEVPCVRTIFDRRKHALVIPEAPLTNRIKVQPSQSKGKDLAAEFGGPSIKEVYDETKSEDLPNLPQKFVPKIPVEMLPESSFGKMWRRPDTSSPLLSAGLDDKWRSDVSLDKVKEEFINETFSLNSKDKSDCCYKSEQNSSSCESTPPSSAETATRRRKTLKSKKGNVRTEHGGGDVKSTTCISEDEVWEDAQVESTPVLPFTASCGSGGGDDENVVIEVEQNHSDYIHMTSGSSSSTSVNSTAGGEAEKLEQHLAVLKLFTIGEEDRSMINLSGMNMDARAVDEFYTVLRNVKDDRLVMKWNYNAVRRDMKGFVKTPVAIGTVLRCFIVRNNKGIDRNIYPTYYMHLEEDKRGSLKTLLMAARKRKRSTTSNYLISMDPADLSRRGPSYVGKVRSNLMGTQFTIYDAGSSPKKFNFTSLGVDLFNYRQELGVVIYQSNLLGIKGPRKMKIIIPAMLGESERCECRPDVEEETIIEQTKKLSLPPTLIELRNRAPVWNSESHTFVLNFLGRVTQASVKNFQIIHEHKKDYVVLQFGRIDEHNFTMDFRYPLCPLQAFSIALTSFDNKIACE